jgi:hypothetical protein
LRARTALGIQRLKTFWSAAIGLGAGTIGHLYRSDLIFLSGVWRNPLKIL